MKTYTNMSYMNVRKIKHEEFPTTTKAIIRAWLYNKCWISLVKMDGRYFFVYKGKSMNTGNSKLNHSFLKDWVRMGLEFQEEVENENITGLAL